jgi:hypothetical protein
MDCWWIVGAEPEGAWDAKIKAVVAAIDPQCRGEPSRATREVAELCRLAMKLHGGDAVEWFEGTNQDAASHVSSFAAHIEHEVIPVGEIDVAVAVAEEERAIAPGRASVVVAGWIAGGIGLGLDDAAAEAARGKVVDNDLADEETSELDRIRGQFCKV